jgi:hypothetical protein
VRRIDATQKDLSRMNTKQLFNQRELADRWGISHRSLERWRWKRRGPPYVKIGNHVRYELSAIEAYEAAQRRLGESDSTSSVG